jgi:hypothetical protein
MEVKQVFLFFSKSGHEKAPTGEAEAFSFVHKRHEQMA